MVNKLIQNIPLSDAYRSPRDTYTKEEVNALIAAASQPEFAGCLAQVESAQSGQAGQGNPWHSCKSVVISTSTTSKA